MITACHPAWSLLRCSRCCWRSACCSAPGPRAAAQDTSSDEPSWANPGPYRAPLTTDFPIQSFGADQRIVGTYFFYWYDAASYRSAQAQRNFDPYPFHPPNMDTISFRDPDWYEKEFKRHARGRRGRGAARLLGRARPVRPARGAGPELNYFATEGIPPMVEALDRLAAAGHAPQDRPVPRHHDPEQRRSDYRSRQADLLRLDPRLLLPHPATPLGGHRRSADRLVVRRPEGVPLRPVHL